MTVLLLVLAGVSLVGLGLWIADRFGGVVFPAAVCGFGAGLASSVATRALLTWGGLA